MNSKRHCLQSRDSVKRITMYESKLKGDKVLGPYASTFVPNVWYSMNPLKSIPATFVRDKFVPCRLFEHYFSLYLKVVNAQMLQQLLLISSNNNTVTCRNLEVDVLHLHSIFLPKLNSLLQPTVFSCLLFLISILVFC